ncbi:MAG: glycoside hydrolase [Candidatus Omnitrophica bacterium CG1_02_40_15]|nr:MAG: glycoside hydrolase [Candidatus Omnitrophica bacterium CG1_02_40_15]
MHKGYLCLVLHAHLPFVRHPEEEDFLEENWLYEAITETYIPFIQVFEKLIEDHVDFRITMSLTPTLASMLQDELLQNRYIRHIDKLIELADKEVQRTGYDPKFHGLALMYYRKFVEAKEIFVDRCKKDLVSAFKRFQDIGCVEILASCATHGFLPILSVNPTDADAQVKIGVGHYRKTFGRDPVGFWLPECGYAPGIDNLLADSGIKYFFVDSHGIVNADPAPKYSVYAPLYCPTGVAAFGRDWESSKQVWSSKEGYPGDPDYREYYKDIGHELEYEYIKPYIHPIGFRINTGLKYWRITGDTDHKEPYVPEWAKEKAATHAGNFMFNREKQIEHVAYHMDRKPMIISPYDAELFGHWWFEGPMWIDFLIRKIAYDQKTVKLATPSDYLREYPVNQMSVPSTSTWGYKGYNEVWLEGSNDWIYRHLHAAGERMKELAEKFSNCIEKDKFGLAALALNQAARELLLAQASDWPFIMKTGTMVEYANKRVKLHINRFTHIYKDMLNGSIDKEWLKEVESRDNIFSDMDCAKYYSSRLSLCV